MSYVARRSLAAFLGVKTGSQAKADRCGQGPGGAVHVSDLNDATSVALRWGDEGRAAEAVQ